MKHKRTPGPWETRDDYSIVAPTYITIAYVALHGNTEMERANARLIAASPDLLDALKLVVLDLDLAMSYDEAAELNSLRIARAAIAKATGEQP